MILCWNKKTFSLFLHKKTGLSTLVNGTINYCNTTDSQIHLVNGAEDLTINQTTSKDCTNVSKRTIEIYQEKTNTLRIKGRPC